MSSKCDNNLGSRVCGVLSPSSWSVLDRVLVCELSEVSGKSVCADAFPVRNRTKCCEHSKRNPRRKKATIGGEKRIKTEIGVWIKDSDSGSDSKGSRLSRAVKLPRLIEDRPKVDHSANAVWIIDGN